MRYSTVFIVSQSKDRPPLPYLKLKLQLRVRLHGFIRSPNSSSNCSNEVVLCSYVYMFVYMYRNSYNAVIDCWENGFRPSFGIAFNIDGIILRSHVAIGGSPQALRRLYGKSGIIISLDDLIYLSKHVWFPRKPGKRKYHGQSHVNQIFNWPSFSYWKFIFMFMKIKR